MPTALPPAGADLTLPNNRPFSAVLGLSMALHVAAFAWVATRAHASRRVIPDTLVEASIEASVEEPPPPPLAAAETPLPNHVAAPVPAAPTVPTVHREAPLVHAIAPTTAPPTEAPIAEAPPVITAPGNDALPRFTIASGSGGGGALAKSVGTATTPGEVASDGPFDEASVDVPAKALSEIHPPYPFIAQSSGASGTVKLEIVLTNLGTVANVRATSHLGHGLEDAAVAAAKKTRFRAAMKRGQPVAVRMAYSVDFKLE